MKKAKILSLLLCLAMALSLLAGCGFSGSSSTPASTPAASTPGEGGEPASTDDTLNIWEATEIKTLVQWACSETNAFTVLNNAFEGLFRSDANHEPQPALATGYEVSDDGLTYTFTLRDNIQWSNGTEITADDFVFGWLQLMTPNTENYNDYSFIMTDYIVNAAEYFEGSVEAEDVGVTAVDEKTLVVDLVAPTPYFVRLTTMPLYFPLNREYVESQGANYGLTADSMIYSGPYVITSYDPQIGVSFEKNESYWDAANVAIQYANLRIIKEDSTAYNAYQAGELSEVKLTAADAQANMDNEEYVSLIDFSTIYLQFNITNEAVSNVNIRKALSLSIDRETFVNAVLTNGAGAATGLIPDYMSGYGNQTFREMAGDLSVLDVEEAKALWDKGVEELGYEPQLTLLVMDEGDHRVAATYMQSEWRNNLGIEVEIDAKVRTARNELMDTDNYIMGITAWGADYDDAMTYLDMFTIPDKSYYGNFENAEYNALIASAKNNADEKARADELVEAERILVDEVVNLSPIYFRGGAYLVKSNLHNLVRHPFGAPIEFKYAYFED